MRRVLIDVRHGWCGVADRMRRREFIALLGGAAATWPAAVPARSKVPVIGFLAAGSAGQDERRNAFVQAVRDLGYVDGQNLFIEWRYYEANPDHLPRIAGELVAAGVALIVVQNVLSARAVRRVSGTVPVVMAGGDSVGTGLVTNISRPTGNLTGITNSTAEIAAKRLLLLKEAVPPVSRVAVLLDPSTPINAAALRETERAAANLNVQVQPFNVATTMELDAALAAILAAQSDGLLPFPGPLLTFPGNTRERIISFATINRLPQIWEKPSDVVKAGAFLVYGPDTVHMQRQVAWYVGKLLSGANPIDLPMQQATRYYLGVNLSAAKAMRISVPPTLLARADEVIE